MKKYFYMAVATIAALSSCDKNSDIIGGGNDFTMDAPVFTATIEGNDATKTTLVDGSATGKKMVNWSNGDQISINGSLYSTTSTTSTASFNLVDGQTAAVADAQSKYKAVYPASLFDNGTLTLPASYTYEEGKFNMPMYAESSDNNLSFKNICGVIALTIPRAQLGSVTKISITSRLYDNRMNGAFTVNSSTYDVEFSASASTTDDKTVSLVMSSPKVISSSETFYIPIPAATYGGFYIKVYSGISYLQMEISKSVTIQRNKLYALTFSNNYEAANANGHQYVDLGLSVKWSTMNFGATSVNGEGDYYQWAATSTLYKAGHATDWTTNKDEYADSYNAKTWGYDFRNTPYQVNLGADQWKYTSWKKYYGINNSYQSSSASPEDLLKTVLDESDDVVYKNWGYAWRIPSKEEFQELINNCDLTVDYDECNIKLTSKVSGFEDKYITLPYNVHYWANFEYKEYGGVKSGICWTNTVYLSDPMFACTFYYAPNSKSVGTAWRYFGLPIRPVRP